MSVIYDAVRSTGGAVVYNELAPIEVTITVSTNGVDSTVVDGQPVDIQATNLPDLQGTVELHNPNSSLTTALTVTAWDSATDTITATFNKDDMPFLTDAVIVVKNSDATEFGRITGINMLPADGQAVTIAEGELVIDGVSSVVTPYTGPDPVVGDQVLYETTSTEGGTVTVNPDLTFVIDYGEATPPVSDSFNAEFWSSDGTSKVWTAYLVTVETPDEEAPTITNPSASSVQFNTATVSVDTDEATGTMYLILTDTPTRPTVSQVKAGLDYEGNAALYSSSVAVSAAGTVSFDLTGLTESSIYYVYFQHTDGASNESTVVGTGFETRTPISLVSLIEDQFTTMNNSLIVHTAEAFAGSVDSYSITAFPADTGYSFNTSTGELTGTPTVYDVLASPVTVTVTASNTVGSESVTFDIYSVERFNVLSLNQAAMKFYKSNL